ncbi:MAG: hypothetical protein FWD68_17785 [Alphaproteobacteria bacterium]|nr:hypothetical protein [Alphaproteobacteria bacterium]
MPVGTTDTAQHTPQRFEAARVLETAIGLLWRNKATCLWLLLCLATLWTAFFYSLSRLLPSLVGPGEEATAPLSLAILATLVSAPFLLQPALVDIY